MPPALILRSDGATLYITRDLAAAFYRHNTYHFDKCLYVVAYQQNLHFKQLFKIIELMGHDWYKGMEHVSFGMVSYEGQRAVHPRGLCRLSGRPAEQARSRRRGRSSRKRARICPTRTRWRVRSAWAR